MDRRRFLAAAGVTGVGLGATAAASSEAMAAPGGSDAATMNFLLNLEYLQSEFYSRATTGTGLPDDLIGGVGVVGPITGGRAMTFGDPTLETFAHAFAFDERCHVELLRDSLGPAVVARPAMDFDTGFTALTLAAGLTQPGEPFDAFADDQSFLLSAYVIEDVGVTAYRGAISSLANREYVDTAAGILGVEAYQAGFVRTALFTMGLQRSADSISAARGRLSGGADEGFDIGMAISFAPADDAAMVFARSPGQVLNVLYVNPGVARFGGFYPAGVNGELATSG
ncbi:MULTISPECIES: ferritin-like domain-containing protein [unclassified Mycobacterium]|uniref:ferritin-like domain-containing protein n=1 Tax=unclassified Mycobacterium TaxID=2642494 RepID=UPI0029C69BD6|nr:MULTISPECIES: ferritin-like domain-containing protein [unclassified Mycobacterium]